MSVDNREISQRQEKTKKRGITRRQLLKRAGAGALVIAAGPTVGTLLDACKPTRVEYSTPKDSTEKAIDGTLKVYERMHASPNITSTAAEISLTTAAVKSGSVENAIHDYVQMKNKGSIHQGDTYIYLDADQAASLTSVGIMQGLTVDQARNALLYAYQAYAEGQDYSSTLANTFESDKTPTAINIVGMEGTVSGGLNGVIDIFNHLKSYINNVNTLSEDDEILRNQPSAIALALTLRSISKSEQFPLQKVIDNTKFFDQDVNTPNNDNHQTAAILALGTEFAKGNRNKVQKIFDDMKGTYSSSDNTALFMTLASVIDGFDSDKVKKMHEYASNYTSTYMPYSQIGDETAAQLVLATASQEAVKNGKIPPGFENAVNTINLLPIILLWWFFFRPGR